MKARTRLLTSGLVMGVSLIFGISALAKLLDFDNTTIYFRTLTGLGLGTVRNLVALLIFVEMLIAFALPIKWYGQKLVQGFTLLILVLFLATSLIIALMNGKSCGCFGTLLNSHPWITVIKNTILIAMMTVVKSESGMGEYA